MAKIDTESQKELRQQISEQFGNLLEMINNLPQTYKLATQINEAFDRYAGYAEMLTENQNTKEFQQL